MRPVLWLDVVGLTHRQIGAHTPHLSSLAARGSSAPMTTVLPAVTCSAQATLLTGQLPSVHIGQKGEQRKQERHEERARQDGERRP